MQKSLTKKAAYTVAAIALATTTAWAAVTFNPTDGTGFVGKGDLQLAFGWNNAQAQSFVPSVSYRYDASESYTAVCTWTTGEGTRGEQTHNVTHNKSIGINAQVDYDMRKNSQGQITGVRLLGYVGNVTELGAVPVVGDPCPGNQGTDGVWTSVVLTSGSVALYATYNGTSVKIWPPAI